MFFLHHSPTVPHEQLLTPEHPGQMSEAEWALKGLASVVMHPLDHKPHLPRHVAQSGLTGLVIAEVVHIMPFARHETELK